jgi:hypothetical protein
LANLKKGILYWNFNNSLLKDSQYVNEIKSLISQVKLQYASEAQETEVQLENISNNLICFIIDDKLFFETLLMEIRGKTISYSSYKQKQEDKTQEKLMIEIGNLERQSNINVQILDEKKRRITSIPK